jgi:succinyl-CoA synthetase beta subunit
MAKIHEAQGKQLLKSAGISIPKGQSAKTPEEAERIAAEIGGDVVVKAQAWVTSRAAKGAILFANSPKAAKAGAENILGMKFGGFVVDSTLVEERLDIQQEFYAGLIVDDHSQAPMLIVSVEGGSGIEEIAQSHPESIARKVIDVQRGLRIYEARDLLRELDIHGTLQRNLADLLNKLYKLAIEFDARAAEINPIVLTTEGKLVAADCRITIDDYAVYRQKALGIEVAREFDRPPTLLERIAWQVEEKDYRGTFYFIQLEQDFEAGEGVIGFHGAGGGGSMMSMDAILNRGYRLANFVDTSGNPPASKVYRAARIILAQPGLDGYFASGSGVASQEQFHSARGLVKAFMEVPLRIPAVIRLGGNAEDQAIEILNQSRTWIPASLEAYGKDDSPEFCAERMQSLIQQTAQIESQLDIRKRQEPGQPYQFSTVTGGEVTFDHQRCSECTSKICIERCVPEILHLVEEVPVLRISQEQAERGGCIECLACEIECFLHGNQGGYVELPIPGLEEALALS